MTLSDDEITNIANSVDARISDGIHTYLTVFARDIIDADNNKQPQAIQSITIKDAMERLKQAMIEEPYYAHAWNRNIAQACYESMPIAKTNEQNRLDHKIANESATTFMKRFFGVETSKDMLLKDEDK